MQGEKNYSQRQPSIEKCEVGRDWGKWRKTRCCSSCFFSDRQTTGGGEDERQTLGRVGGRGGRHVLWQRESVCKEARNDARIVGD